MSLPVFAVPIHSDNRFPNSATIGFFKTGTPIDLSGCCDRDNSTATGTVFTGAFDEMTAAD